MICNDFIFKYNYYIIIKLYYFNIDFKLNKDNKIVLFNKYVNV